MDLTLHSRMTLKAFSTGVTIEYEANATLRVKSWVPMEARSVNVTSKLLPLTI